MTRVPADLAELAAHLHGAPTEQEAVDRVIGCALKVFDNHCACLVMGGRRGMPVHASDPLAAELANLQLDQSAGPDLDVWSEVLSIVVSDVRLETRWPEWARRASAAGLRSLLAVRIQADSGPLGVLHLYDEEPNRFSPADRDTAQLLARHAAIALAAARKLENLERAVEARTVIGQAQGILMARYDLTPDQAFSIMLRYSQSKNLKLNAVAAHLVSTRELPEQ